MKRNRFILILEAIIYGIGKALLPFDKKIHKEYDKRWGLK